MLLLFIIAFIFDQYVGFLADGYRDFLIANPILTMILVGLLPIAIEAGIAMLLARKNIVVKI